MEQNELSILDSQMQPNLPRLMNEVGLEKHQAGKLATSLANELMTPENSDLLAKIECSSPLSSRRRLLFFEDYQIWDTVIRGPVVGPLQNQLPRPLVERSNVEMQWIVHFYCSLVFPGDTLFQVLKKSRSGSCLRKCASYIRENPVRAFRNAFSHGNWDLVTPTSVRYWARKGGNRDERLTQYDATFEDIRFYLDLTRCTAWTALLVTSQAHEEPHGDGRPF